MGTVQSDDLVDQERPSAPGSRVARGIERDIPNAGERLQMGGVEQSMARPVSICVDRPGQPLDARRQA